MFKKFIIILICIINLFVSNHVFGADTTYKEKMRTAKTALEDSNKASKDSTEQQKKYDKAKENYDNSNESAGDITSRGFTISVDQVSPGMGVQGSTTKENVNYLLGTIIQNLMIALGSLALLIMTVGAGYILIYHGQDELLSKGKTIFMSGVYAMIVALSAYYIVSIVRYLLYFGDN